MNELRDANRAYGEKLAELGAELPELVVLDADLAACSKTAPFIERFPGRHYNVGIQECNMVGVAAGMAACGKIPFVNSFGMFTAGLRPDTQRRCLPRTERQGRRLLFRALQRRGWAHPPVRGGPRPHAGRAEHGGHVPL